MKYLKQIAYVLLLIGGLNLGVYGISGHDFVDVIFGSIPMIAGIVYVLVGLSAVYIILNRYILCSGSCHTHTCCSTLDSATCSVVEVKK